MKQRAVQAARDVPVVLALVLGFLVLYVGFSPPGLVSGDSTELAHALDHYQPVHPPGYPLYLVLGRALLSGMGVGGVPGAHWLSGLYGALTLGLLYAFLRLRGLDRIVSAGTAGFLGGSYPVWSVAVRAEVYTLLGLLLTGSLLLWELVRRHGWGRRLLWLVAGLGLTHHPFGVLGLLLAVDATRRSDAPWTLPEGLLVVLPGSLYLLLLVPGSSFPFNWPQIGTLGALWTRVTGGSFHRFFGPLTPGTLASQGGRVLLAHLVAFPGTWLLLLLLGYRERERGDRTLLLIQVLVVGLLLVYNVPDLADFLLPSYLVGAWFVGRGWDRLGARWGTWAHRLVILLGAASLLVAGARGGLRYDWRGHQFPGRYVREAPKQLRRGIVLSDWSHYTLLRHAQLEGRELRDVYLPTPTHRYESWPEAIRRYHRRGYPVHVTHTDWPRPPDLRVRRRGFFFRVLP